MSVPTVGYIGLDHHHCEPYLQTLAQLPATVTCACEPNPAFDSGSVEGLNDVPIYRSTESLLESENVDIVWITLSNRDTPSVITTALDHGIDIFTEKPAARTSADLEPVVSAAESSDSTVCVSYAWRGHPIIRDLRNRAADGFFGNVRAFEARFLASNLIYRDLNHYLFDAAASRGGILQWLGVHWLDVIPWLLNDPIARVSADISYGFDGTDVEDGATVQLQTESGAIGTLNAGYYLEDERYDTHIAIHGTSGRCAWDPVGRTFGFDGQTTLELERVDGEWQSTPRRRITHDYDPSSGYGGQWGLEFVQQFLEARRSEETSVPATIRDALDVLRVLDAAYEAAESSQWVTVETEANHSPKSPTEHEMRQ